MAPLPPIIPKSTNTPIIIQIHIFVYFIIFSLHLKEEYTMKVWCKQQIFPDSANEGRYTIGKADTSLIDQFLSILVHVVIILLILTTGDVVHPLLVVEIPAYGLFNTLLELQAGFPTEFSLQFG